MGRRSSFAVPPRPLPSSVRASTTNLQLFIANMWRAKLESGLPELQFFLFSLVYIYLYGNIVVLTGEKMVGLAFYHELYRNKSQQYVDYFSGCKPGQEHCLQILLSIYAGPGKVILSHKQKSRHISMYGGILRLFSTHRLLAQKCIWRGLRPFVDLHVVPLRDKSMPRWKAKATSKLYSSWGFMVQNLIQLCYAELRVRFSENLYNFSKIGHRSWLFFSFNDTLKYCTIICQKPFFAADRKMVSMPVELVNANNFVFVNMP